MRYVALLDGRDGAYGVVIPDLPGCTSAGDTAEEALADAQQAAVLWADEMTSQGCEIPPPRSVEEVWRDPKVAAAIAKGSALVLIPLVRDTGRPARVNV